MNLVDTLLERGHSLRHEGGGNYRLRGHGGLIVKDQGWYSHSIAKGGGAPSLFQLLEEKVQPCETKTIQCSVSQPQCHRIIQPVKNPGLTDQLFTLGLLGYRYLLSRDIDLPLLNLLAGRGWIMQSPKGYVAFMGHDEHEQVRCVSMRSIHEWYHIRRYERSGSNKCYTFAFPLPKTGQELILCEGPIDALSIACMEHRKREQGYERTCKIATCGAPTAHILSRIRKIQPRRLFLAFDNDIVGRAITGDFCKAMEQANIPVYPIRPRIGKDPNDWWRNRHKKVET
jgi:hypothetical protein